MQIEHLNSLYSELFGLQATWKAREPFAEKDEM